MEGLNLHIIEEMFGDCYLNQEEDYDPGSDLLYNPREHVDNQVEKFLQST